MTAPSMPTSVQVGPHRYSVSSDLSEHKKMCRKFDSAGCDGLSEHRSCVITIDPRQHITMLQDTLLHEVMHCVLRVNGWAFNKEVKRDQDPEEFTVRSVTAMLLDTMKRNPDMVHYLMYDGEALVPELDDEAVQNGGTA